MSDIEQYEEKNENSLKNEINISEEFYQNNQPETIKNIIKEEENYNSLIKTNEKTEQHNSSNEEKNDVEIDLEKNNQEEKIKEENSNDNNIILNELYENNDDLENIKIDEYLKEEDLKCNKEYIDDENDIRSCRLTARDNNNKYLEIKDETKNNNTNEENSSDNEEKEDLFPFRIIGDVKKKSEHLGKFNNRYLELDSMKGLFKRYKSSKDYPKKPKEIIDVRNFKTLRKVKAVKEYYDLEIEYTKINKKGEKVDKLEVFRLRNSECRNKWYDSLLLIWKYFLKGTPVPKFTKNILLFVDDRIGIIQEIGRENKKKKKKNVEINLQKFQILGLLGVGGFGTVFKVKHKLTDKIYAMKVMNKNYIIQKKYLHYVVSEFEIMKSLAGFPFVLDLHYCFQSPNFLYIIIDYCPNGDFTKLKKINNLKLFFAEVILAFEHIHNHNIIYRDLKPENLLLDESGHIRVCDFNLAKAGITKNKRANSFCGSPLYFSPEMVSGKGVNYKCDIYGIGLLIYELVTGKTAFNANNINSLYALIKKNKIDFNLPELKGDIKDLLEKILVKNPDERLTLEEIKQHPYFKDIDFDKVLRKEYGKIVTEKKKSKKNENKIEEEKKNINNEDKEKIEYKKFKLQQKQLDENKEYSILKGKITVKEMALDQKRAMKNYVREFYYVKKEDIEQTKDFQLEIKGKGDITSLIVDNYEFQV